MRLSSGLLMALIALACESLHAQDTSVPHTFESGTTISSSQMNENFTALVTGLNGHEARVAALEENINQNSTMTPVWVDATGRVVGVYAEFNGLPKLLVKYPESDLVFSILQDITINTDDQSFAGQRVIWSESNCSGTPYFQNYGLPGSFSLRYTRAIQEAGATAQGIVVYPDFDTDPIRGKATDPIGRSSSIVLGDGSVECSNNEFDYGTQSWILGVVGESSWNLDVVLPVTVRWR